MTQEKFQRLQNQKIDYAENRRKIIENQPVVSKAKLSDIELCSNKTMKLNGKFMPVSDRAYTSFVRNVLEIPAKFDKEYLETKGPQNHLRMLNEYKNGKAKKVEGINIIGSQDFKSVLGFGDSRKPYVTNEGYLNAFEMVMNKHPELELRDMCITSGGTVTINARSTRETVLQKGEEFLGGLSFQNSPLTGSKVSHNVLRMVCSNGMIAERSIRELYISTNPDELNKTLAEIQKMANNGYMPGDFTKTVEKAMRINASLGEVDFAINTITNNSSAERHDVKQIIGFGGVRDFLKENGVDLFELRSQQFKNCPTNMKVWELVNYMTHFGTHDDSFGANKEAIQSRAGVLLFKKAFDMQNQVIFGLN